MTEDRVAPCPHHSDRKGAVVRYIVLHNDGSPVESATVNWLAHKDSEVSYHVLLHRDGTATRFVPDDRKAWHAGKSRYRSLAGVNPYSLGLAFSNRNDGKEALTDAQLTAAHQWVTHWRRTYPTIREVLTHQMVSAPRKNDPEKAPNFDLTPFSAIK